MTDNSESSAKINFKQAIIVALITSVTTIAVTLISTKSNKSKSKVSTQDCSVYIKDISDLKGKINKTITAENLSDISSRFFKVDYEKKVLKDNIKKVVSLAEEHLKDKEHYAYDFYLLKKKLIEKPKGNINTRVYNSVDTSAYKIIQRILINIQSYEGPVSGVHLETMQALIKFQRKQNTITENYINKDDFGILGNKTYIAMLGQFKHTN